MAGPDEHTTATTPDLRAGTATSPSGLGTQAGSRDTPPAHLAAAMPVRVSVPGHEVYGEIARGGMGVVLAARDLTLDREVAIKVLRPDHQQERVDELARRFVLESKSTTRLPHPGVPPVYALGELPGGRPFLAMKLVRGKTLGELLAERPDRSADVPRFVGIFEQVCQAVGFAHSQGIIHRDLKPSNVMVGAFGEVQVMDWGLAKDLTGSLASGRGGPVRPASGAEDSGGEPGQSPGEVPGQTEAGAVLGSPAYMAPEQARGEPVDARADVFALGGLLYTILTGGPPFGGSRFEVLARATAGDVSEAFARLDGCGADAELVGLCKRCLSADPAGRPADGGEVAGLVAAYRAGVEDRLRRAETERAAAEARAESEAAKAAEQRKRRRAQLMLAGAVGLLVLGGGAFAWWQARQAERRELDERQARQGIDAALAQATALRKQYRFKEAGEALELAGRLAASHGVDDLKPAVARAGADLELVTELDDIRYRKWVVIVDPAGRTSLAEATAPPRYREALAARGFDVGGADARETAVRVRQSAVKAELVDALDDWAVYEPEEPLRQKILEVARLADPGPWHDRFRDPAARTDPEKLAALARDAEGLAVSPAALSALGAIMEQQGIDPTPFLRLAQTRYPAEFTLAFTLGRLFTRKDNRQAIGYYRAAVAARPDSPTALSNLGGILLDHGNRPADEAIVAVSVGGGFAVVAWANEKSRTADEAIVAARRALELAPDTAGAHVHLGIGYAMKGDMRGAAAEFRKATEINANIAVAWADLGTALYEIRDLDGAADALRRAVQLDPKDIDSERRLWFVTLARKYREEHTAPPPREVKVGQPQR